MTTTSYTPPGAYTISGVGPYTISFEYQGTQDIVATVVKASDGSSVDLAYPGDFTISPLEYADNGDLTLSAQAASDYAGDQLFLTRRTAVAQTFDGQNPKEEGIERNLDRMARNVQEADNVIGRAVLAAPGEAGDVLPAKASRVLKVLTTDVDGGLVAEHDAQVILDLSGVADLASQAVGPTRRLDNIAAMKLTAGTSDDYVITAENTPGAYAFLQEFTVLLDRANTGAVTLNIDGMGAKAVRKFDATGSLIDLAAADWRAGEVRRLTYNGTVFIDPGAGLTDRLEPGRLLRRSFVLASDPTFAFLTLARRARWTPFGAGGGGGNVTLSANTEAGAASGGNAGEWVEWEKDITGGPATCALVIGAGGAPTTKGGDSTVTWNGITVTALGGEGGINADVASAITGTNVNVASVGAVVDGEFHSGTFVAHDGWSCGSTTQAIAYANAGEGANGRFGPGGRGQRLRNNSASGAGGGAAPGLNGGGGGAARILGAGSETGGAGGPGGCIIDEFS